MKIIDPREDKIMRGPSLDPSAPIFSAGPQRVFERDAW